jgi:hypothetical protein
MALVDNVVRRAPFLRAQSNQLIREEEMVTVYRAFGRVVSASLVSMGSALAADVATAYGNQTYGLRMQVSF